MPARPKLPPDELARRLAERLAAEPPRRRLRLRQSVLVGRLFSGTLLTLASVALFGLFYFGLGRLIAPTSPAAESPSTIAPQVAGISLAATSTTTLPPPGSFPMILPLPPTLPSVSTTIAPAGGADGASTVGGSSGAAPTTTATATPTTTPTTSPVPTTPSPPPTTTTPPTTVPPTPTTTLGTTTTLPPSTTTTVCCPRPDGQGCLPPPQCP